MKLWNTHISFFIKFNVLSYIIDVNKSRLKNIFCSFIQDFRIWREISLMFDNNILSFDHSHLYFNYFGNTFNSLSLLLFEIYISEFDFYVFNLSRYFYYKYFYYKDIFYRYFLNKRNSLVLPLVLKDFHFIYQYKLFYSKPSFFYSKYINYLRYLGYFFFGIAGSIFFTK